MKQRIFLSLGILLLAASIMIFLYPALSNSVNQFNNNGTIAQYNNSVSSMSEEMKNKYLSEARKYNENLNNNVSDAFTEDEFNVNPSYEEILNFADGQIGTVKIPKINVNLPIYHGTSEEVLSKGAVHSENTSFPIGGQGTHSVISAHTAYPGKVFFDKLTDLAIGDIFYISVLGDTLTYEVCEINTVEPSDTSKLKIVDGKDYVTLVTCTPYSVNTHRLLVRGKRIQTVSSGISVPDSAENLNTNNYTLRKIVAIILIVSLAAIIIIGIKLRNKCPSEGQEDKNNEKKA